MAAPSLALAPFLLLLGAAPWWFGSNRPFAWGANAVALGALLVVLSGLRAWPPARPLLAPALLAGAALAWGVAQTLPLGPQDALWRATAEALGGEGPGLLSPAPALGQAALLRALTDAAAFLLAWALVRDEAAERALLLAVFVIALLPAAYALAMLAAGDATVLGLPKRAFLDAATGPFFNRNSLAILCALGIVAGLEWGWAAPRGWRGAAWAGMALLVLALLLTRSRAGVALAGFGVAALLALRHRAGAGLAALGLAAAGLAAVAALRPSGLATDAAGRVEILAVAWRAALERPWTGQGFGAFEALWPIIRTEAFRPEQGWDRAHSTWLEASLGLGLPASLAIALALLLPWLRCLRGALRGTAMARFAAVAFGIVALHSLVEFSLQVQALSLLAFAALGAGLAAAESAA